MTFNQLVHVPGDWARRDLGSALAVGNEYADRLRNASEIQNSFGPLGETTLLRLLHSMPRLGAFLLNARLPEHMDFIGAGSRHVIVQERGAPDLLRIHLASSTWLPRLEQLRLAQVQRLQHAGLREHFNPYMLPQSFAVEDHPFRRGLLGGTTEAVVARQRAIEYHDLNLFHSQTGALRAGALEQAQERYPDVMPQLGECMENVSRYYRESGGQLVDTTAMHALVVQERSDGNMLWLRTGLPTPNNSHADYNRIVPASYDVLDRLS